MNFLSDDIRVLRFNGVLINGYSRKQVDEVLRQIAEDYREREDTIEDLKNKISMLKETVDHYKTIEESMQHCLIIAQHTGDEIVKSANEKAKDILDDADSTSHRLISEAYQQANKIKLSFDDLKAKVSTYRMKSEAILKSQLDVLNQLPDDSAE
ncbi:MAG TPA: DivIVA domain-containing protein [Clostridia bacterium]|nr:DivIVA domain-containing protein [Clostridia bacterium]